MKFCGNPFTPKRVLWIIPHKSKWEHKLAIVLQVLLYIYINFNSEFFRNYVPRRLKAKEMFDSQMPKYWEQKMIL